MMSIKSTLPPCSRCHGKMILDSDSGDSTCFSCGHTVYAVAPSERASRPISHAGQSLN
jgi:hypothetical protein